MTTRCERVGALALVGSALCIVLAAAPAKAQCVGDCNNMGTVQINELILGVSISLGMQPIDACPSFDCAGTGTVPINCLIQGVNNSLSGCPATPTVTAGIATATATVAEPTSTATVELPTSTATVELPTSTATVELPTSTATVELPTSTATVEGPTATATIELPTATATVTGTAAATATPTATGEAATPTATMLVVGCGNNVVEDDEECDGTDTGICPDGAGCFPSGDDNECECAPASCANIDANGADMNASGTFTVSSAGAPQAGDKYCGGLSAANAFGPCVTDAECGGTALQCVAIPWLGVATFAPFPITGVSTTFTASAPDAKCVHTATIPCTGSSDPCPGTPKLGAGFPCCTTPGFTVNTFFIPALGFCSRVDQIACGSGIVDTSVPMLGDNDVAKEADTTTPNNADCTYDGTEVHPACVPGTEDKLGTIATTIGDGAFDSAGGHSRFSIPQRSVTWAEGNMPAPCNAASMYDETDGLITSFELKLVTTTATATAAYVESPDDNDTVDFCGFGPGAFGGVAVGIPDLPGAGSMTVAVGAALSGGAPTLDLLFSAMTPLTSPVLVEPVAPCVPPAAGCPE